MTSIRKSVLEHNLVLTLIFFSSIFSSLHCGLYFLDLATAKHVRHDDEGVQGATQVDLTTMFTNAKDTCDILTKIFDTKKPDDE